MMHDLEVFKRSNERADEFAKRMLDLAQDCQVRPAEFLIAMSKLLAVVVVNAADTPAAASLAMDACHGLSMAHMEGLYALPSKEETIQ